MQEDDLFQPLWRYPARWLTFAAARDRWSYLTPGERKARRQSWPAWRRAVFPVGLVIWWAGMLVTLFIPVPAVAGYLWCAVLALFAAFGVRDWLRDGRDRRHSKEIATSANGSTTQR